MEQYISTYTHHQKHEVIHHKLDEVKAHGELQNTWMILWDSSTTPIAGLSHPKPLGLLGRSAICEPISILIYEASNTKKKKYTEAKA